MISNGEVDSLLASTNRDSITIKGAIVANNFNVGSLAMA